MGRRLSIITCFVLLASSFSLVSGQVSVPAVEISCEVFDSENISSGKIIFINESDSSIIYTVNCNISNPTTYIERVKVNWSSHGLNLSYEGILAIGANSEENVSFPFLIPENSSMELIRIYVSATVIEANGATPPNNASAEDEILILFKDGTSEQCTTKSTTKASNFRVHIKFNNTEEGLNNQSVGFFDLELNYSLAPIHSENFALLSQMGCYENTIFHRVVEDFVIQGGDFVDHVGTGGHAGKFYGYCNNYVATDCSPEDYTLPNEADNGLNHTEYVLSMARASNPNSATSQFFIVGNNSSFPNLDGEYTIFGKVTSGFDIIDAIFAVETESDMPIYGVMITRIEFLNIDLDGDGVIDEEDSFPNDPTETEDSDGDGVGDNADAFPNDKNETLDSDDDGVGDNADAFPNDANETSDSDGDGVGDNEDAFPDDGEESVDSDDDGVGDNADADPNDATVQYPSDINTGTSNSALYAIAGAITLLALVLLFARRKPPNYDRDIGSTAENDFWNT